MANIYDVKEALIKAKAEARSLASADNFDGSKFEEAKRNIEKLEKQEAALSFAAAEEARSTATINQDAQQKRELESGIGLFDAIRSQLDGKIDGALAEYNQELRHKGRQLAPGAQLTVPGSVFEKRTANTSSSIGALNQIDYQPNELVRILRNQSLVSQLPVRHLGNLHGNPVIPVQDQKSAAYWVTEGNAPSESNVHFKSLTLSPKHLFGLGYVTRQAIQQGIPGVEQILVADLVAELALALDTGLLYGDGTLGAPTGIINQATTNTGSLKTLDWPSLYSLASSLRSQNIDPNAILLSRGADVKLATTLKSNVAGATYLKEGETVAGLPAIVSNQLKDDGTKKTGTVVVGDFSEIFLGSWSGVDLLCNPYGNGYEAGNIGIRAALTVDVALRRPNAITVVSDIAI